MISGLKLNCSYVSEEMMNESELIGKEITQNDITEKPITFYVISHVIPINKSSCTVVSDGCEYMVSESADKVNVLIAERMSFKLN
jgi:hypothetical protein